jgi:hypothetical protein
LFSHKGEAALGLSLADEWLIPAAPEGSRRTSVRPAAALSVGLSVERARKPVCHVAAAPASINAEKRPRKPDPSHAWSCSLFRSQLAKIFAPLALFNKRNGTGFSRELLKSKSNPDWRNNIGALLCTDARQ